MRRPIEVFLLLTLVGCASEAEPETSTLEGTLVSASLSAPSPTPGQFERMQARDGSDVTTAQLNFELRLVNTGTQMAVLERANVSYTGAAALAPQVNRADLRRFYLEDCAREGFGVDKSGALSLDLPDFPREEIRDVEMASNDAYLAITGYPAISFVPQGLLTVGRFVVAKLKNGNDLDWQTAVPFLGFEDRATALTLAKDNKSYVVVGMTRPIGSKETPFSQTAKFAAARVDTDGKIAKRPDATPWQRVIAFPGCTAEAVDVIRVPLTPQRDGYFIAGNAECGGDKRVAVAMLDEDGVPWAGFGGGSFIIDPAQPAAVGGVAFDPIGQHLYVVGSVGDDVLAIKLTLAGGLVPGFGAGGIMAADFPLHDRMVATDAKVLSDRRLVLATSSRVTATGQWQLGMARFLANSAVDPTLPGGFKAVNVPGMTHSYGQAVEVHENESWFTISGYADNGTKRRMAAAAFAPNGSAQTQFDNDGFLIAGPVGPAPGYASAIAGDYITMVGANGNFLGGARYHRKDGSPDDPTVLDVGDTCALLWPDTGVLPVGATHPLNQWSWGSLPTAAAIDVRLAAYGNNTLVATTSWSGPLAAPTQGLRFPGHYPGDLNYWKINFAHAIEEKHRHSLNWSAVADAYINDERYGYDIGMSRWDEGSAKWTALVEGTDGDQNDEFVVWGHSVYPMADGVITHCSSGVAANIAPGVKDVAQTCNSNGMPCYYATGGNSFRIQHADGSTSYYAHLQNNLDKELCPFTNDGGPVPLLKQKAVRTSTKLGVVGNSGNSTGPHLHLEYSVAWDATDPAKRVSDYADGRPLLFDNVRGVRTSVKYDDLPSETGPYETAAQWSGTHLLMRDPDDEEPPETSCTTVDITSSDREAREADGDAGPTLYCPGESSVCVENGDGSSACQTCGQDLGERYPGCPCDADNQCGTGMICWGDDFGASGAGVSLPGLCYPGNALPVWSCGYDCRANRGDDAWCYNEFASLSGRARCMDALTAVTELEMCWIDGYEQSCTAANDGESCVEECMCSNGFSWANSSHLDTCEAQCGPSTMPAREGECVVECLTDADCRDGGWNYPSEYECDNDTGVPVCRIPL